MKDEGREKPCAIVEISRPNIRARAVYPVASSNVHAGFPSPADDYVENQLDLNELLVPHPTATFFVRVEGDSMVDANIQSGDVLVVDRSLEPSSGKIVVAILNGEFTVKRLIKKNSSIYLSAENPAYSDIRIESDMDFQVWGVVSYVIHKAL